MNITRDNYEEWLLRKVENDLSANEAKALDRFLAQHPEVKMELEAFEKTILTPPVVTYKNKKSLYRETAVQPKVIPIWQRNPMYWAAAASIALVVGLSIWLMNNQNPIAQPDVVNNSTNSNNTQLTDSISTKPFTQPKVETKKIETPSQQTQSIVSNGKSNRPEKKFKA